MDFTSTLDKSPDDIPRPPLQPAGTYVWVIEKVAQLSKSPDGKTEYVDFPLRCVAPTDDVDADALAEFGPLKDVRQRIRFFFNSEDDTAFKRSEYNLKRFLFDHVKLPSMPMKQALTACANKQVLGSIVWKADTSSDEGLQFANIGKTAPVE